MLRFRLSQHIPQTHKLAEPDIFFDGEIQNGGTNCAALRDKCHFPVRRHLSKFSTLTAAYLYYL